jgi:prepilin-type N-terminal cleavage/methylation domain-containing protein
VRRDADGGFTLIELLTAMVLAGILMTLGLFALRGYLLASRESGTASDIRSVLRLAAERSLSEGRTYCVSFTATTWALYKADCTVSTNKVNGPWSVPDSRISLANVSFPAPSSAVPGQATACSAASSCAYFYPRGTALAGSLLVTRSGKTYTISVEGLTARVSVA